MGRENVQYLHGQCHPTFRFFFSKKAKRTFGFFSNFRKANRKKSEEIINGCVFQEFSSELLVGQSERSVYFAPLVSQNDNF